MIIDCLNNMGRYVQDISNLATVIEVIQSGALRTIEPGQYKTGNPKVRYNVFAYETQETSSEKFEIHEQETDVQILLEGHEKMECAWDTPVNVVIPYDASKDAAFVTGKVAATYYATTGSFVIFAPGEPHAPSLNDGISSKILKVVFKIHS